MRRETGAAREREWQELMDGYAARFPDLAAEFRRRMSAELPDDWSVFADAAVRTIAETADKMATRKASLKALNTFAPKLPELVGGSADLTGSNLTRHSGSIAGRA